jgi:peptide/nickel transport system ATP-binding protein
MLAVAGFRRKSGAAMTNAATPLLEVQGLRKYFPVRNGWLPSSGGQVHAVDGVSFAIGYGETLGLVGESGCGKSTVGKVTLKLTDPSGGRILLRGKDITKLSRGQMRPHRRNMQVIFQDPFSSLNPRMTAGAIVAEPLINFNVAPRKEIPERIAELFQRVGLPPESASRLPHEFSGGQRQRLGIARALALRPSLILGDEPVSALDVSIQAQVINLLVDLQKEFNLSYLFIAHDLAVVEHISHRVAVMYLGKIVELADTPSLFGDPLHPYTEALLAAVPRPVPARGGPRRRRVILQGDVPSPISPPSGCRFRTRCRYAFDRCKVEEPAFLEVKPGHWAACHLRGPTSPPDNAERKENG